MTLTILSYDEIVARAQGCVSDVLKGALRCLVCMESPLIAGFVEYQHGGMSGVERKID
jgi:hypothetical protein